MSWEFDTKDVITISAALLSLLCFVLNFIFTRRIADRSLSLDAQKILLELDRQLVSDAWLWALYDDHAVRRDPEFIRKYSTSVHFQAKLEAFAYLKLNMFEVVLAESRLNLFGRQRGVSKVWRRYFRHTLQHSSLIRNILDRPETKLLYNQRLLDLWVQWKRTGTIKGTGAAAATA